MNYYELTSDAIALMNEYLTGDPAELSFRPSRVWKRFYFETVVAHRRIFPSSCPINYLKSKDALAFVAQVEPFENVMVLSVYGRNFHDNYFFGPSDELDGVKLLYQFEGETR